MAFPPSSARQRAVIFLQCVFPLLFLRAPSELRGIKPGLSCIRKFPQPFTVASDINPYLCDANRRSSVAYNVKFMNLRKLTLLVVLLLIADQALKIWVKTHMTLGESITVFPDWFQLLFIENKGAAFGMHIPTAGGFDWGKLLLGLFRVAMIGVIGYLIWYGVRRRNDVPNGALIGGTLIFAGALGNILDSAFYGLLFSESTPLTVAHFGGHYAGFMMGKVVDMFYFPLFQWNNAPQWLGFLLDSRNYFFGPVFNLADTYISVAVVYLLIFQHKFLFR